jgi:AcrR family transcriptional regulator
MVTLDQARPIVKRKRGYDARRRQQAAAATRHRVTQAAEQRFLRDGYGATTIAAVAADARVSVDTIYKSFGGKPGLVRAISKRALEGAGPVPAERRSDQLQELEPDPRKIIEGWGAFTAEISPRAAPILLLIRSAAATDADARSLQDEIDADRLHRMTSNARRLRKHGHLRAGLSAAQAADVMWTCSSPELYELLVLRRGWPAARYGRFVADAMIAALI